MLVPLQVKFPVAADSIADLRCFDGCADVRARITDVQGPRLRLAAGNAIRPGSALECVCGEVVMLGKVTYCSPVQHDYEIWLEVGDWVRRGPRTPWADLAPARSTAATETVAADLLRLNEHLLEARGLSPRATERCCTPER
jgi:hypothetical protein